MGNQLEFTGAVYRRLRKKFGTPVCPLDYSQPHELAIAVILSAQCTDEQVNRTTPELFRAFPKLRDYCKAPIAEVERLIYSTGFYRNKARSIQGFCRKLIADHDGVIPQDLASLVKLPGVGRKTANVILQVLYEIPSGMVVDTHVARISGVLGLTVSKDPVRIEKDLVEVVAKGQWIDWSLYMIFLGRLCCTARKRECGICPLVDVCPSSSGV